MTDITEHIIVVLHEDNWETDLKSLATEKPLQEWIQLAHGLITDQGFVDHLQGVERFDPA